MGPQSRQLLVVLGCTITLVACAQAPTLDTDPLQEPWVSVLPTCSDVTKIADEDRYMENPFYGLPDGHGSQHQANRKWMEESGVQREFANGCGSHQFNYVEARVYELDSADSARRFIRKREQLLACGEDEVTATSYCFSTWQSAIELGRYDPSLLRSSALRAFVHDVPAVFAGVSDGLENLGDQYSDDWVYEEQWLVIWLKGRYVVAVGAGYRDRDFIIALGAPRGLIPATLFDTQHMVGTVSMQILARWPEDLAK